MHPTAPTTNEADRYSRSHPGQELHIFLPPTCHPVEAQTHRRERPISVALLGSPRGLANTLTHIDWFTTSGTAGFSLSAQSWRARSRMSVAAAARSPFGGLWGSDVLDSRGKPVVEGADVVLGRDQDTAVDVGPRRHRRLGALAGFEVLLVDAVEELDRVSHVLV